MDGVDIPAWSDLSTFKTPVRVLAQQFLASRKRWKAKYKALHEKAKSYRIKLRDLRRSRDHWKQKAKALAQEIAKERRLSRNQRGTGQESAPSAAVPPRAQRLSSSHLPTPRSSP
jgi:hypothetical protein